MTAESSTERDAAPAGAVAEGARHLPMAAWGSLVLAGLVAAAGALGGPAVGGAAAVLLGSAAALGLRSSARAAERRAQEDGASRAALRAGNERLSEELDVLAADLREIRAEAQRLERERQEAETASLAKGAFLANMSHEIRTPMNAILGMGRLLSETDLTREQKDFTHTILDSADTLVVLLNDVLDLSKIEAGKLELDEADFDLHACLEKAVHLLLPKAAEKGLEAVCLLEDGVPQHVRGDSARLRQIVINLLSNAFKFTREGEVRLRASAVSRDDGGIVLSVEVEDTGPGISGGRCDALFAPFMQESATTSRRFGGTGLGLAISRQLAETMGGDMGVESREGRGSRFWFTARLRPPHRPPEPEPRDFGTLHGLRVLLVDDNDAHRSVVRGYLERWGTECVDVATAEAALAQVARRARSGSAFDVALIDSDLGETDGIELAQAFLQDPAVEPPGLVLLKTFRCQYKASRLSRIGFDAWISKPVWPRLLREALLHLRDVAEQVEVRHALRQPPEPEPDETQTGARFDLQVLLVEDNVVNQKVATLLLQRLGCAVDVASDGLRAVEATRAKRYDVVFMDCQMPVMNGFEATRSIRSESAAHVPIIAMTANAMEEDRELCMEVGMDDYLSKPVNLEQLEDVLERWAGDARAPKRTPDPDMTEPRPDALDPDVIESLRELSDGDSELLAELVDLFLQDTPQRLEVLGGALEQGDNAALESAAHALKSSCANIGALLMSEMCRELELLGREERVAEAAELVERSRGEFQRVREALREEVGA